MSDSIELGMTQELEVLTVRKGVRENTKVRVVTEIPLTVLVNGIEVATITCSPSDLKELVVGYLRTSLFIRERQDIIAWTLDSTRWLASIQIAGDPDPDLMGKRVYTTGCGKGIVYSTLAEVANRREITNGINIYSSQITALAKWLQSCSAIYRETGGVHSAALSLNGESPILFFDDIGRHNAVDRVVGAALLADVDLSAGILICSGRVSSEILHKARVCEIPILIARGAPTHQTILRARDLGITLIGFARGDSFVIFSHPHRVLE